MYSYLLDVNAKFTNVSIDPTGTTGGYNYETGALTFKDNSAITSGLAEEFVHLFQDKYYPGGMAGYIHNANFEFEAKVIQDLECTIRGMGCGYYGSTESNNANYGLWLDKVTNQEKSFPSYDDLMVRYPVCNNLNYLDFLDAFSTNSAKPLYNLPVISTLTPQAIPYIKNNPCN